MTASKQCKAKDPNNCRFHTPREHAEQRIEQIREEISELNSRDRPTIEKLGGYFKVAEHVRTLESEMEQLNIQLDSYNLEELKKEHEEYQSQRNNINYGLLQRIRDAERYQEDNSAAKLNQKRQRYTQLLNEENTRTSPDPTDWRSGYKQALNNLVQERGQILLESAATSYGISRPASYGVYEPKVDRVANKHFKECGHLTVVDIKEDSENYDHFSSMNDDAGGYTEHYVVGKTTCKCGKYVDVPIEARGTLASLLKDLLN